MGFDSPFGDGQSESCASGVACTPFINPIEAVKDTFGLIFRDSGPLIFNHDSNKSGLIRSAFTIPHTHPNGAGGGRIFNRIVEQINNCHSKKATVC